MNLIFWDIWDLVTIFISCTGKNPVWKQETAILVRDLFHQPCFSHHQRQVQDEGNEQGEKRKNRLGFLAAAFLKPPAQLQTSSARPGRAPCRSAFEDVAKAQGLDHGNIYACE